MKYRFIDLFAGAGGLSEGFIRAGYEPIAQDVYKRQLLYRERPIS